MVVRALSGIGRRHAATSASELVALVTGPTE